MKITAIVQARMGSTRLPGKVLMDLGGKTVLARVVARLHRASRIHETVVATTQRVDDDDIVRECDRLTVSCFRGSEQNVLARYLQAAERFQSDLIVRITADCPLIDPDVVDEVVDACLSQEVDLACNDVPHTFPRGLDVEAFTIEALRRAQSICDQDYQREHVTQVMYEYPHIFKTISIKSDRGLGHLRWTLDTPADLELIRAIYARFENKDDFGWGAVADLIERYPELTAINAHIIQKQMREIANVS
jgi:spore coat polysaccharide biosynthesis protein SpsF